MAVAEVLELQAAYSSSNTSEMGRRGDLIRNVIPVSWEQCRPALVQATGLKNEDLLIEGRDGTGLKSRVPWVRFASKAASPSATAGWYVVLLHRRDGAGAYLALAHGSTQFDGGAFIARSDEELARLMAWGRAALSERLAIDPTLVYEVRLGAKATLALAYEKSCLAAYYYPMASIPSDAAIQRDMLVLADLLGRLYRAERLGLAPHSPSPDVRDADEAINGIAKPSAPSIGQGFTLTAPERRAVEIRAMGLASAYFQSKGFSIKDVSATESFDLLATQGSQVVSVEVKGTTGSVSAILLTSNEVELHKREYPENALVVVHGIELTHRGEAILASGGSIEIWMPWLVDDDRLKGIAFKYSLR